MENIIVSFDSNLLKLTYTDKKNTYNTQVQLDETIVDGSHILNEQRFAQIIVEAVSNLESKPKKPVLHFLISPENVYTFFMTFGKNSTDIDAAILNEARKKLEHVSIDEIYYSYQKIAPFVYQFVGVKKQMLEDYIEVSNITKIPVQSIIPWLFLFPKVLADNDPCIFITKVNNKEVIALSEFNGIYYNGLYDASTTTSEDIERLVSELSIYKRVNPIKRVFLADYEDFNSGTNFVVSELPVPINGLTDDGNYKLHILFNYLYGKDNSFLFSNANLLNLLQLPAIQASNKKLVYVGVAAILLLLMGGVGFFALSKMSSDNAQIAGETTQSQVLSEKTESKETTQSTKEPEIPKEEVKKENLKIRVENGAGIPGIAAKTQSQLEGLGYIVTGIGNSEGDNRENTLLRFKNSKADYKVLLSEDLKKDYELVVEDGLAEDSEYDVLIILGTN